jgi:DNA-binding MarR family transcriptional regulator
MDSDRDFAKSLAFEVRDTLSRGARRIRVESGPPLPQLTVMGHLQRRGAMSTNELAAAERVRPQSMSNTVRQLEEAGLVDRRPHPTDRRQVLLELTRKGVKMLEKIFAVREDWLTTVILQELTDAERQELHRALDLIRRVIDTP